MDRVAPIFCIEGQSRIGGVILVSDSAPEGAMLPPITSPQPFERYLVRPGSFDEGVASELVRRWLRQVYRGHSAVKEWVYTEIPPGVLVEEFLESDSGEIPDYKFFMIHGKCELIQLDQSRFSGHRRNLYTPDWNLHQISLAYPMLDEPVQKPANLGAMISLAESLAYGVDFLRVDLYCVGDRIFFGELTNYPGGGHERFSSAILDRELGAKLREGKHHGSLARS